MIVCGSVRDALTFSSAEHGSMVACRGVGRGARRRRAAGDLRWRGLARNTAFDVLRENVLVAVAGHGAGFHVGTLDLYSARSPHWPPWTPEQLRRAGR